MADHERDRPPRNLRAGLDARVTSLDLQGLDILGAHVITCLAVGTDGTRVVCTGSALYTLSPSGLPTLLAGHQITTGFIDNALAGQGGAARFCSPSGIAVDGAGNVLVVDMFNHALRKVARNGVVSTLAGNGMNGYADGVGNTARFNEPYGIAVDANGTIFVTDFENNCVRQVRPDDGAVSTLAGNGAAGAGFADGLGLAARFKGPAGLALNTEGHLIVADSNNNCIRRVMTTNLRGLVTTVAGSRERSGGFADGVGAAARFLCPTGIAVDANNNILVADTHNHCIRMIAGFMMASLGARVTTVAGSPTIGTLDGMGTSSRFNYPGALALDEHGRLLVVDHNNRGCLRVVKASLAPSGQLMAARVLFFQVHARTLRTVIAFSGTCLV